MNVPMRAQSTIDGIHGRGRRALWARCGPVCGPVTLLPLHTGRVLMPGTCATASCSRGRWSRSCRLNRWRHYANSISAGLTFLVVCGVGYGLGDASKYKN